DGRAVRARIVRDVTLDAGDGRAEVTLARGGTEKATVIILGFVLAQLAYMAIAINFFQRPSELRCDRGFNQCTLSGSDMFGSGWQASFSAGGMARSELVPVEHGELKWVVRMKDGTTRDLANPTGRGAQIEQYRRGSDALNAFIADGTQHALDAR